MDTAVDTDLVLVRWMGPYTAQIGPGGPKIEPGGTFKMPLDEAQQRADVEIVNELGNVIILDAPEPVNS